LLGRLIEEIAGGSYADVLQRELFDPLELETTGVDDVRHVRANAADPYTAYALAAFEHADEWDPSWEYGTGGLFSTAADLIRWNAALRGGRVVSPASYARMATSAALNDGTPTAYGFGLGVNTVDGVREVRHAGGLPGFTLENVTYPDLDLDIIVLTNRDGISTNFSIVRPILARLLDRPELARFNPAAGRPVTTAAQPPDPAVWVAAARAGRVDELGLSAAFRRFLSPARRRALQALRELGDLRGASLVETSRRDPYTYFTFRLAFEQRPLLGAIHVSDTGEVAHLGFTEWDQRPVA
jgi:CubicO group peptidase (beta-lactamase class C family)